MMILLLLYRFDYLTVVCFCPFELNVSKLSEIVFAVPSRKYGFSNKVYYFYILLTTCFI